MNDFNIELIAASNAKKVLEEAGVKDAREAVKLVPFDKLTILPDFNVREHDTAWDQRVRDIANDFAENGYRLTKPMLVFVDSQDRLIVYGGHTRHAAISLAISEGAAPPLVPVFVARKGTSMEDLTADLAKDNEGTPLSALGQSVIVKRLLNMGRNVTEIARKMGYSPKYVNDLLVLAAAPSRIRELITQGLISATFAIEMLNKHGDKALEMIEAGLNAAGKDSEGKQAKVTKKHVKKAAEESEDEPEDLMKSRLIKEKAVTLFQFVEMLLIHDAAEPKDTTGIDEVMDRLDIIVSGINEEVSRKAGE